MSESIKLSEYCLIDHPGFREATGYRPPSTPLWLLRTALMALDKKMHFTGLRGGVWRVLGVDRSGKNPNLCNI